jgi:hypothetical protein
MLPLLSTAVVRHSIALCRASRLRVPIALTTSSRVLPATLLFSKRYYSSSNRTTSPHRRITTMSKQVIATDKAPGAIGPYSQAIRANGFLFVSGCIGLDASV